MLSKDLSHAYKMQQSTTRFFAGCCAKAGHAAVEEWFKVPFEHEAPTPTTFAAQEKALQNSVLLLAPANRKCFATRRSTTLLLVLKCGG